MRLNASTLEFHRVLYIFISLRTFIIWNYSLEDTDIHLFFYFLSLIIILKIFYFMRICVIQIWNNFSRSLKTDVDIPVSINKIESRNNVRDNFVQRFFQHVALFLRNPPWILRLPNRAVASVKFCGRTISPVLKRDKLSFEGYFMQFRIPVGKVLYVYR